MNSYIINFAIYTFAMIGFIGLAVFVYKKSLLANTSQKGKDFLNVENSLRLSATKTVYIIKAGKEKFLIAGDPSSTTMLAKLDTTQQKENIEYERYSNENVAELPAMKKLAQRVNRG